MMIDKKLADFVHTIFQSWGNCTGYCEICKKSHPACGGDEYEDGKCPDNCDGCAEDFFSVTNDFEGRQVGMCCWEKVFGPIKKMLDLKRFSILKYYSKVVDCESNALKKEKQLLNKAKGKI